MEKYIGGMTMETVEQVQSILTEGTGRGQKSTRVVKELLPLLIPIVATEKRVAAGIFHAIETVEQSWEFLFHRLYLSDGGALVMEGFKAAVLAHKDTLVEKQQTMDTTAQAESDEAELRRRIMMEFNEQLDQNMLSRMLRVMSGVQLPPSA